MRLLTTDDGELRLEDFAGPKTAPSYAILSHRWESEEITYQDLQKPNLTPASEAQRRSWAKICNSRRSARRLGYSHIWIDSCCIDQKSSAELSESINSMYDWYERAGLCIAYLADDDGTDASFRDSVWWKRGWTLQELIAPKELLFYTSSWKLRDTRFQTSRIIEKITGISRTILAGPSKYALGKLSAATKMSWAAHRETTKEEDIAYSLLGLFEIHLPVMYGEGQHKALWRFQREVYELTSDHTIFAWDTHQEMRMVEGYDMLAPSPTCFGYQDPLQSTTYYEMGLNLDDARRIQHAYSPNVHGLRVQFLFFPRPSVARQFLGQIPSSRFPKSSGYLVLACTSKNENVVLVPVLYETSGQVFRLGKKIEAHHIDFRELRLIDVYLTAPSVYQDPMPEKLFDFVREKSKRVSIFDGDLTSLQGLRLRCEAKGDPETTKWAMRLKPTEDLTWSYVSEVHSGSLNVAIRLSRSYRACLFSLKSIDRSSASRDDIDTISTFSLTQQPLSRMEREVTQMPRFATATMAGGEVIVVTFFGTAYGLDDIHIKVRLDWERGIGASIPITTSSERTNKVNDIPIRPK